MNIALDIILFLIIIAIIVILTWGGVTDWTFKSQSDVPGSLKPFNIVILPTKSPQTPPPQTQSPKPCSKNSYQYWDQIPPRTCYGISDGGPVCRFLTGKLVELPTGNDHWAYKKCMKIAKKNRDEHESGMAGGLLDINWKGPIPASPPDHHHKRYNCVQDPSILGGKCVHARDGRYDSIEECQRNCGPVPYHYKKRYNCVKDPSILGGKCEQSQEGQYNSMQECQRNCGPAPNPRGDCCCGTGMQSCTMSTSQACSEDSDCKQGLSCIKSGFTYGATTSCNSPPEPVRTRAQPDQGSDCASRGPCPTGMISTGRINPPCCKSPNLGPGGGIYHGNPSNFGPGGGIYHGNTLHLGQEYFKSILSPDNSDRIKLFIPDYYY